MSATRHQRRPTPYGDRLRAAMDALGPFCPGIDPHAALLEQWGLPDTVAGLETLRADLRRGVRGSRGRGQAAVGVLRAVRVGRAWPCSSAPWPGCATPARCRCSTSSAATSARRWPATPRPTSPTAHRCGPTPSRSAPTSATSRCARRSTSPRRRGAGVFVLTLTSNPEGPSVQHAVRDGATRRGLRRGGRRPRQRDGRGIRPARQRRDGRRRDGRQRGHRPRPRPRRRRRPAARTGPRRPGRHARGPARDLRRRRCPRCSARAAARCSWRVPTSGRCATPRAAPPTTWPRALAG